MKINLFQPTPGQRLWIYRVVLALLAVLVGYHLIDPGQVPLWVDLVGAMLSMGAPAVSIPVVKETIAAAKLAKQ